MARPRIETDDEALSTLKRSVSKPFRRADRQCLPFPELDSRQFEIFCFLLLKAEHPGEKIFLYGGAGDRGRDIVRVTPEGTTILIQCKHFASTVGVVDTREELAKLCMNQFRHQLPETPDKVGFYVSSKLTNDAQDLLRFRTRWRECSPNALARHLGRSPTAKQKKYADSWWPALGFDEGLSISERARRFPRLLDTFFGVEKVIDVPSFEAILSPFAERLDSIELRLASPPPPAAAVLGDVSGEFAAASQFLLSWPSTLDDGGWIERPELARLLERIGTRPSTATVLLGTAGSGKSALLARLCSRLATDGTAVLALKADKIDVEANTIAKLSERLGFSGLVDVAIRSLAQTRRVVVVLDQLDALAELVDLKSERLNALLHLVRLVHDVENVHIVCSSRTFDYRHDTRLAGIQAETIELELPKWETIAAELKQRGILTASWPESLKDLLRVPQHLMVFLQRRTGDGEDHLIASYQQMLDDLWVKRVMAGPGGLARSELLTDLAEYLGEREELWAPAVAFENRADLMDALEAADILMRADGGLRIGFRHQTLFEHARARAFTKAEASLTQYVVARQDGLFVRPTLWAVLRYLRQSAPARYASELEALCRTSLRLHVRCLLIDFLGHVTEPQDHEVSRLKEFLGDATLAGRAISAVRGQAPWFERLAKRLPALMRDAKLGWPMAWFILDAWGFARGACLALIGDNWLPRSEFYPFAWHALSWLKEWDASAIEVVAKLASADTKPPYALALIISQLAEKEPAAAVRIIGASLGARLHALERDVGEERSASAIELALGVVRNKRERQFIDFVEQSSEIHDLVDLAKRAPFEFTTEILPLFRRSIQSALGPAHSVFNRFRGIGHRRYDFGDAEIQHRHPYLAALDAAVGELASVKPESFDALLAQLADDDSAVVQSLLCRGLCRLDPLDVELCVQFLTADARRLVIGNTCDDHAYSRELLGIAWQFASPNQIRTLEDAIWSWSGYRQDVDHGDAETKRDRQQLDREERLELFLSVPTDLLSAGTHAAVAAEKVALPRFARASRRDCSFGRVESPMNVSQMENASDSDVLNLFAKLPDGTEWWHSKDGRRSGGVYEASRELATLVKAHPERGFSIIAKLLPEGQHTAAGAIIRALSETDTPFTDLFDLIRSSGSRGFKSTAFREDAANAISAKGGHEGLTNEVCELLEVWLEESKLETGDVVERSGRPHDGSVVWQEQFTFMIPGGTYPIMRALTRGYLLRKPPAVTPWLNAMRRHLKRDGDHSSWQGLMTDVMQYFSVLSADQTNDLLREIFAHSPDARDSEYGAILLALLLLSRHAYSDLIEASLRSMETAAWPSAPLAFGELLALSVLLLPPNEWANDTFCTYLANDAPEDERTSLVRAGIAYTAGRFWNDSRHRSACTSILVRLVRATSPRVRGAIFDLFRVNDMLLVDQDCRDVLSAIASSPHLLLAESCALLVEHLAEIIDDEPELVHKICAVLADLRSDDLASGRNDFAAAGPDLVNIAITLQRFGGAYREKGLALFERLLALGVHDAQAALDALDRRLSPTPPSFRARFRRRRRSDR